jgi:aminoglycoside/choline kinase family phosphotransferase
MKGSTSKVFRLTADMEKTLMKTSFLSYYISMYNTVNENLGYKDAPVSVDEIYEFLQDLRHEASERVPDIEKEDIAFSFHILNMLGVCKRA